MESSRQLPPPLRPVFETEGGPARLESISALPWIQLPSARSLLLSLPVDARRSRLGQLVVGLVLLGTSAALLVLSREGVAPWDVLHQGLARHTGIQIGTWSIIVAIAVLAIWIPLRERPGVGTISNTVLLGLTMNVVLTLVPAVHGSIARWACCVGGILLNGVATGIYIGAGLGAGPRDGLMTGLARRTGRSLRLVRTVIEVVVLGLGWMLGGTVGAGTVLYLVAIGPLAHRFVPLFSRRTSAPVRPSRG
ncbi:MAG: hypothetical protein WCH31_09590 [Actinomycetes bacterium]